VASLGQVRAYRGPQLATRVCQAAEQDASDQHPTALWGKLCLASEGLPTYNQRGVSRDGPAFSIGHQEQCIDCCCGWVQVNSQTGVNVQPPAADSRNSKTPASSRFPGWAVALLVCSFLGVNAAMFGWCVHTHEFACLHACVCAYARARTHTCLHTGTCTVSARGGAPSCRRRWTKPRSSMRSRCMRSGGLAAPAGRRVLHRLRPIGANRNPRRPRCRGHRVWLRKHRGKGGALGGALDKLRRWGWMRSSCLGLVGA